MYEQISKAIQFQIYSLTKIAKLGQNKIIFIQFYLLLWRCVMVVCGRGGAVAKPQRVISFRIILAPQKFDQMSGGGGGKKKFYHRRRRHYTADIVPENPASVPAMRFMFIVLDLRAKHYFYYCHHRRQRRRQPKMYNIIISTRRRSRRPFSLSDRYRV